MRNNGIPMIVLGALLASGGVCGSCMSFVGFGPAILWFGVVFVGLGMMFRGFIRTTTKNPFA